MFDVVESKVVIRGFAGENFTKLNRRKHQLYQVYNLCIAIYVDYVPVLCNVRFEMSSYWSIISVCHTVSCNLTVLWSTKRA